MRSLVMLALIFWWCCAVESSSKSVRIALETQWSHTSLLDEASEYFASCREPGLFWKYIMEVPPHLSSESDLKQYEWILEFGKANVGEIEMKLLKLALSSRKYSVVVASHSAMSASYEHQDCPDAFVVLADASVCCSASCIVASDIEVLEGDHVWTGDEPSSKPSFVVYARLGAPGGLQDSLAQYSYIWRHLGADSTRHLPLSGYGVDMLLKSTEYKVIDDDEEIDSSVGEESDLSPLSKSQLKRLGMRVAQAVMDSDDPISLLSDVSQNLPSVTSKFSDIKVSDEFAANVAGNRQMMGSGNTVVLINGRHVNVENVDFFEMYNILREELEPTGFHFDNDIARQFALMPTSPDVATSFDLRGDQLVWLNDVENDPMYQQFPRNLRTFLQQQWPGSLYRVRRNVINAVVVLNVENALAELTALSTYFQQALPIRIGIILVGQDDALIQGFYDLESPDMDQILEFLESPFTAQDPSPSYGKKVGLWPAAKDAPMVFINGQLQENEAQLIETIVYGTLKLYREIQMLVHQKLLKNSMKDLHGWFLERNNAQHSYSRYANVKSIEGAYWTVLRSTEFLESLVYQGGGNVTQLLVTDGSEPELVARLLAEAPSDSLRLAAVLLEGDRESHAELSKYLPTVATEQVRSLLGLPAGVSHAIITDGFVVPIADLSKFSSLDITILNSMEARKRANNVAEIVADDEQFILTMQLCSLAGSKEAAGVKRYSFAQLTPSRQLGDTESATVTIDAVLDPLSRAGQKFSTILGSLVRYFDGHGVALNLYLNPEPVLEKIPLLQYYRYVCVTELSFDSAGNVDPAAYWATFDSLPSNTLFSMNLDTPDSWVVESSDAPEDLDNLKLSSVTAQGDVVASYTLTHLLVEGNVISPKKESVKGIELVLESSSYSTDTLVMENLGYFQLRVGPGSYSLHLRKDSPSALLFKSIDRIVVHTSFSGSILKFNIEKNAGMEGKNLFSADGDDTGKKGGSFSSWWRSADPPAKATLGPDQQTINVFSLASGHLYERFLGIMMASVMRTTKNPVKFWFLRNFLSPQFKRFIPVMAQKYGFEYELVSYVWPRWLRRQTEKQRILWAYKILFLDVLFPLDVDRVIFVDADQIMRGDLQELHTLDLQGAPYGYTPFCSQPANRRLETKGFRFWESGYWKDTLRGKKYHISAIYVIDLKRFREIAAGDQLRATYQQLSADPNSLANLDQDLPNVMQSQLPMFDLPEEWLWCQAWCTDESLKVAKSIDLCNNPLLKTPKIEMAKKIVPEWIELDEEVGALRTQVEDKERQMKMANKDEL